MKNKNLILAIFLVLVVFLGSSAVFAEDASDMHVANIDETDVQESTDMAEIGASQEYTVTAGSTSDQIQDKINSMSDGDTLNFESGTYDDICIYVANKSITINGNGAILKGYDTPSKNNTPELIYKPTNESGYAIGNLATLYIVKANNVTINGLNIVGGAHSGSSTAGPAYSNAIVYVEQSNNLKLSENVIEGSSWGLYLRFSNDCIIADNQFKNQEVTGILSFGSARTSIKNNRIFNAKNHGIDVRHGTGPNVQVINNTVIGSKEGIYLMHSQGHTAAENKIINCTISAISCYGSSNIKLYNNTMQKSRIGVLLGGGYTNINIGQNTFSLDNLPYPPTFVYYVAEAKSDYQSATKIIGTYSDISAYTPNYVEFSEIPTPTDITVNYSELLKETGTTYTIPEGATSTQIQNIIDSMNNGDTLKFTENAVYNDISIYTDKNIKIIGNNATLIGYNAYNANTIPAKVKALTNESGYAISEHAVLYILNNTNVTVRGLNIVAQYPGFDTTKVTPTTMNYKTAGIRAQNSPNLVITDCTIDSASWGIYMEYSKGAIVTNNNIENQYTTGILNFGTGYSIIANNTITNAFNHGIDVRHGTGPQVTVFNNTITGSKEGIYLMHSKGHTVYNNTIINSKISSITCYGSGNEAIFNNTLIGSRIGVLLGGGYYNVTIGANTYNLDALPFPPTFVTYIARADSRYQSDSGAMGTFSDKFKTNITVVNPTVDYAGNLNINVADVKGNAVANHKVTVTINNITYTGVTNENGTANIALKLDAGNYTAAITSAKIADDYAETTLDANITVIDARTVPKITAASKTVYLKTIASGYKYSVTLKDANGAALANKDITINFNGKNLKATTNANGVATVKLTATAIGSKKATIIFAGDDNYKATSNTATIKITKQATKITAAKKTFKAKTKTKKYTITLKTKSGKAIAKAKVTLKIKGKKIIKATTNSKGKATFKITKLTKKGKYTATVKFAATKYYTTSSKKVKITVKK